MLGDWLAIVAGSMVALGIGGAAHAADYPDRTITIVVPYPPGASTDLIARLIAPKLQASMGQAIVVENKPGADGRLGASYVAKSPPDGYRILLATQPVVSINPHLQESGDFNPLTDLTPLTSAVDAVVAVAVNGEMPVKTLPELIAYAQKNPGKVTFGSAGVGSPQHLGGVLLGDRAKMDWIHVPYRGGGPMVNDLIAGHVQAGIATLSVFKPLLGDGKIRVLAVGNRERFPGLPDTPTISETLPGFTLTTWLAFYGPKGLPPALVNRLATELGNALKAPDVRDRLRDQALLINPEGPAALDKTGRADFESYGRLIRERKITID